MAFPKFSGARDCVAGRSNSYITNSPNGESPSLKRLGCATWTPGPLNFTNMRLPSRSRGLRPPPNGSAIWSTSTLTRPIPPWWSNSINSFMFRGQPCIACCTAGSPHCLQARRFRELILPDGQQLQDARLTLVSIHSDRHRGFPPFVSVEESGGDHDDTTGAEQECFQRLIRIVQLADRAVRASHPATPTAPTCLRSNPRTPTSTSSTNLPYSRHPPMA